MFSQILYDNFYFIVFAFIAFVWIITIGACSLSNPDNQGIRFCPISMKEKRRRAVEHMKPYITCYELNKKLKGNIVFENKNCKIKAEKDLLSAYYLKIYDKHTKRYMEICCSVNAKLGFVDILFNMYMTFHQNTGYDDIKALLSYRNVYVYEKEI